MLLFFASFSLAAAIVTAILARLTRVELPRSVKPMRAGGICIWLSVGLVLMCIRLVIFSPDVRFPFDPGLQSLVMLILVGAVDDIVKLKWSTKLTAQIIALTPLAYALGASLQIESPLTVLAIGIVCSTWLLTISTGTNLMDGIDGYVGSWSLVTLSGLLYVVFDSGLDFPLAAVAALLLGPLVLFVSYNRNPARVILGDAGSLPLGFAIGLLALLLLADRPDASRATALLVTMTFPLFEVGTTIGRRFARGYRVVQGDLDHIHHRLVRVFGGRVSRASDLLLLIQVVLLAWAFLVDHLPTSLAVASGIAVWGGVTILLVVLHATVSYANRRLPEQQAGMRKSRRGFSLEDLS